MRNCCCITVDAAGLTVSVPACCCVSLDPRADLHPSYVWAALWLCWSLMLYSQANNLMSIFAPVLNVLFGVHSHCGVISLSFLLPEGPVCRLHQSWIFRSETEKPLGGLSQIATRILATSLPMYRKLIFTKLSPSLDTTHLMNLPVTQQSAVELMFLSCCRRHLRFT